jgi:hypothetical protein
MKRHHRLSLSEIRESMKQWEGKTPLSTHVKLTELVFGVSRQEDLMDLKAFLKATGLTNTQAKTLLKARLLLPLEKNRFDREDVSMGKVLAQGLAWGYRVEDLAFYVKAGEEIVDREMKLRKIVTRNLALAEDAATTLEMVKSARVTRAYVVDRLFQQRVAKMRGLKDEGPHPNAKK